ncbi:MAG: hypothetical protein IJO14_00525 [Clostridia bacterium]|nr:hypothetical protein [Clostridia bacterium]
MKKFTSVSIALLLVFGTLFSFAACSNEPTAEEEPTTVFERMETVSEDSVVSYINSLIEKTNAAAPVINVSESFGINNTMALTPEDYELYLQGAERAGDEKLDTLDDTLGFIKTYFMDGFSAPVPEITEIKTFDEADVARLVNYNIYTARNWTSENVTNEEGETFAHEEDATKYQFDEDGNELLDQPVTNDDGTVQIYENGDMVSKSFVCDNKLNVTLSFLAEQDPENTAPVFADADVISKYFTNTVDKEYVLTELEKVSSAIVVSDYAVDYLDCNVFITLDMETEQILSMRFTKNAFVTFDAQGAGSFADLGDFKLAFTFTDTVECAFDYEANAEAESETEIAEAEDAEATEEETDAAEEATEEVTEDTAKISDSDIVVDEIEIATEEAATAAEAE